MKVLVALLLFSSLSVLAVEDDNRHTPVTVSVQAQPVPGQPNAQIVAIKPTPGAVAKPAEPINIAEVCHKLIVEHMGKPGWESFVLKAQKRYSDYAREYDVSDIKRFLDDKLLQLAPSVKSGKGAALREFVSWLALYDFFAEPLPGYIRDIAEEDKAWIADQLQDFNWERVAQNIKEKSSK